MKIMSIVTVVLFVIINLVTRKLKRAGISNWRARTWRAVRLAFPPPSNVGAQNKKRAHGTHKIKTGAQIPPDLIVSQTRSVI
jgi:hypothetical protein